MSFAVLVFLCVGPFGLVILPLINDAQRHGQYIPELGEPD